MPFSPTGISKPRKPRPSRARGLRTSTGCLTCRKRRVKCDETRPRCGQCAKSDRDCVYGAPNTPTLENAASLTESPEQPSTARRNTATSATGIPGNTHSPGGCSSLVGDIDPQLFMSSPELRFDLSPLTITTSVPSPNSAPLEWYDLLAEDAISNIQKHNLGFDQTSLSRRQSPVPETPDVDPQLLSPSISHEPPVHHVEPWNTVGTISLTDDELSLFQHYVNVVGPILDMFDPMRHFTLVVPRLAVHNVGLLKSLLAIAARHLALHSVQQRTQSVQRPRSSINGPPETNNQVKALKQVATQYYYETLHYLSKNLLYPVYAKSGEIIATAILISTYEMFDAEGSYNDGGWERHLRGIFWIQRSQDNNGESHDGLRRAAWWAWLRQDIWVAFRESRRVLTIWRPTKRLMDLSPDELATRIVYITARCVDFAANEKQYDMALRIGLGDRLLQALDDWYRQLPPSFRPIYTLPADDTSMFSPIWIHPPVYAAAMQTFHFARIIVLINQPSVGGLNLFRQRRRQLDESVDTICGIAMMHQGQDLPSAFVNFQAVYAAGLCVQTPAKQNAILRLLETTLDVGKFPPKTLLDDLVRYWREES
ncbi:hypothetical protein P154DRAFT_71244 [Amniculicola lignicola CBS 123094]|uniref:Zn(2)-C6 fungal-type domain-containing protein n=1 Tax=Amniculicola lignicola CBS 123094 TaxID=1392246 RepID=A0A6A5VWW3_9PLEO|nr:hypothetical protein P154DRAFT_71244 [Amniculicola lignicola CBS 123094]